MRILTLLGVNAVIFAWPFLMLAARWGSEDEQFLIRAASPFVLPFTAILWYIALRAFLRMRSVR